jgi:hypothetical protein
MRKKTKQQLLQEAQLYYNGKPIEFFEQVLRVTLDDQQKELLSKVKPGCRIMVKSGKGTGKSFILAGLSFYFIFCFPDTFVRTVSPSYDQLLAVYMREAKHHHQRMIPEIQEQFTVQHDKIFLTKLQTNSMECVSSKTSKKERLGGMHSFTQVFLFDEASGISDEAYYMSLSSMGTAHEGGFVIGVSNPERGEESFYYNLFAREVEGWDLMTFTAQKSAQVKLEFIQQMKELYGEDGDEYRVAILGEFPRSDGSTYIPMSLVEKAIGNTADRATYIYDPTIIGADIARSKSGDSTVFVVRQGCRVLDIISFQTDDTMVTVAKLKDIVGKYSAVQVCMDADGVGGPVADRCRELGIPVVDVRGSFTSSNPRQYANVRTQLWGEMREWLDTGDIPDHYELKKELGTMKWGYSGKMQEQLVSKKSLVDARGKRIKSPDHADALAFTFFFSTLSTYKMKKKAKPIKKRKSI